MLLGLRQIILFNEYTCYSALKSRVVITRDFVSDVIFPVVCILVLTVGPAHQGPVQGVGVRAGLLLVRERTRGGAAWTGTEGNEHVQYTLFTVHRDIKKPHITQNDRQNNRYMLWLIIIASMIYLFNRVKRICTKHACFRFLI